MSKALQAEIDRCWPMAKLHWSSFLLLNDPELSDEAPSIAQIALATRQILLNSHLIEKHGLEDCVEGLLAHEVGHHVRYPGRWSSKLACACWSDQLFVGWLLADERVSRLNDQSVPR